MEDEDIRRYPIALARMSNRTFARYGIDTPAADKIRQRMAAWPGTTH
jgi:hypothetical protein